MEKAELSNIKKALTEASKLITLKDEVRNKSDTEQQQTISEWKRNKPIYYMSIAEFDIPQKLIKVTLKTKEYHALILYGEGGLGKTILVTNEVRQLLRPSDWEYYNGYSTPLSLYEILYQARNKKVLILDDIEGIFDNAIATTILKGALWDSSGKRLVQYNTKSEKAQDLPSTFEFKAKIIILCNKIPNQADLSISAMISRTVPYEFKLTYEQKLQILEQLINNRNDLSEKQKQSCISLVKEETNKATKHFNFRLLRKVIAFVKEDKANAKELFRATTEKDEDKETILKLTQSSLSVEEQAIQFYKKTGKSRRTFFRIKKELK